MPPSEQVVPSRFRSTARRQICARTAVGQDARWVPQGESGEPAVSARYKAGLAFEVVAGAGEEEDVNGVVNGEGEGPPMTVATAHFDTMSPMFRARRPPRT